MSQENEEINPLDIAYVSENPYNRDINFFSPPPKFFKLDFNNKKVPDSNQNVKYLELNSGEEMYFKDSDGIDLLLNETIEESRLIRNIISKIPERLIERLSYLAKFEVLPNNGINNGINNEYYKDLRDNVYSAYIKEFKLRFIFKRLLSLWRIYKMNKTVTLPHIDPITLSEPTKQILVYDWSVRKKFIFDAKSLSRIIETKLQYSEYGFPVPLYPRNPSNNVEFTYAQLVSIYDQLRDCGELRWCFTTLREYNFNKNRWYRYHRSALIMKAISNDILLLESLEARELLSDFIISKLEELQFDSSEEIVNAYDTVIIKEPTHWYLEKFKSLAISHYEAEHFGINKTRIINMGCIRLFKKQKEFIQDLKNRRII
jgi:hypothetical protein